MLADKLLVEILLHHSNDHCPSQWWANTLIQYWILDHFWADGQVGKLSTWLKLIITFYICYRCIGPLWSISWARLCRTFANMELVRSFVEYERRTMEQESVQKMQYVFLFELCIRYAIWYKLKYIYSSWDNIYIYIWIFPHDQVVSHGWERRAFLVILPMLNPFIKKSFLFSRFGWTASPFLFKIGKQYINLTKSGSQSDLCKQLNFYFPKLQVTFF